MDGLVTCAYLNVLALGSYDILIGMDWLEVHRVKLDCYNKNFECMDEEGKPRVVRVILDLSIRYISAMQLKKFYGKGCRVYATDVLEATKHDTPRMEGFHKLQEFMNVFPDEIPGIPPNKDINITFELVLGAAPVPQTPCRMSILEILEMKVQLQELWEKKHIRKSVSPRGAPVGFEKDKDDTL